MPFGGHATHNSKRKENVTEKIREIKQRQQNWLVQREQSKSKETKPKATPIPKPTSSAGASSKSFYQPTIQSYKPPKNDQGKKRVTDTFNHWKKSRESNLPDEDNDTTSIQSDAESELERLVSPDIDTSKHPIAEEEFGSLADKIASRVKHNMGISESYLARNTEIDETSVVGTFSEVSSWESSQYKTYPQSVSAFNYNGNSGLASHHCSVCKSLMSSSDHIPLMIIPCGHTFCKACSDGKLECPECSCSVVSFTVNIMLQQVIHEYHSHSQGSSSTLIHKKSPHMTLSGSTQITLSGNTSISSKSSYGEDVRLKKMSYRSQLLNLHTRQSILSDEHNDLMEKLNSLNKQIGHTSSQTKSIANQEHELKRAIVDLQDKLVDLETHRKQYESQLTDLHDVKSETEGKITLLSGTMASLSQEVEKVTLLAEGEENMS